MAENKGQSPDKRRNRKISRAREAKPGASRQSTNKKTSQSRPNTDDSSPQNSRSIEKKKKKAKSRQEVKPPKSAPAKKSGEKGSAESTNSDDKRNDREKRKNHKIKKGSSAQRTKEKNKTTAEQVDKTKHIKPGAIIKAKKRVYEVGRVIGAGGFGEVYEVHDENNKLYAMKTEHLNVNSKIKSRMKLEIHAYEKIKDEKKANPDNVQHLLYMFDYGVTDTHRWFTMNFTGQSLEHLLKKHEIGTKSAIRIAIQTFDGITELHKLGIMHRDIKPANFVVGKEKKVQNMVYLVDHGMSSLYATELDKVPARSQYRFLGTLSYAPRASHHGKAQCRRDDLESWLYMALEFFATDALPWGKEGNEKRVLELKLKLFKDPPRYLKQMPTCFQYFPEIIDLIGVVEAPKYETFKDVMMTLAAAEKVDFDEPFEWEEHRSVENKKPSTETTHTRTDGKSDEKDKDDQEAAKPKKEKDPDNGYCVLGNLLKQ